MAAKTAIVKTQSDVRHIGVSSMLQTKMLSMFCMAAKNSDVPSTKRHTVHMCLQPADDSKPLSTHHVHITEALGNVVETLIKFGHSLFSTATHSLNWNLQDTQSLQDWPGLPVSIYMKSQAKSHSDCLRFTSAAVEESKRKNHSPAQEQFCIKGWAESQQKGAALQGLDRRPLLHLQAQPCAVNEL